MVKKRISRDVIILIILIPLFLWGAIGLSSRLGNSLPAYSVLNKSKSGLSVFYEALGELKYPAGRSMKPLVLEGRETVQIAAAGGNIDINETDIKSWVEEGGTLIYLAKENSKTLDYQVPPEERGGMWLYKYGRGMVIEANAENLTNIEMTKDSEHAYRLFELLYENEGRKVYFNEAHLYSNTGGSSLWDAVPIEIKFIIYQLLFVLAAYIYYRGKAFGKPIPLYEEVERTENEYLYSTAALYRAAGAWDIMLDNYYKSFLKVIPSVEENWLDYWEREKLPSLDKAKEVYEFINRKGKRAKAKEYIHVVSALDKLKKIFEKRREAYWKTLKKPL